MNNNNAIFDEYDLEEAQDVVRNRDNAYPNFVDAFNSPDNMFPEGRRPTPFNMTISSWRITYLVRCCWPPSTPSLRILLNLAKGARLIKL